MRIRTGYSFRTAVGHLKDVFSVLQEQGWQYAPISDRCSTFGYVRWTKLCEAAKLRPIYGVELGVVPALGEKKPVVDYWTFFAKEDLRDLYALIALATGNGNTPALLYSQALAAKGCIKITGERVLLDHIPKRLPKDFYVGLSPSLPRGLAAAAMKRGLPLLATSDNVFPRPDDREFYRVAMGRHSGTQTYPQYILSAQGWREACAHIVPAKALAAALANREHAAKACKAKLGKSTLLTPPKPKSLKQLCIEGAKKKGCDLTDQVYGERLKRELAMIAEKKFEDYFFIIADMVQWAKQRMIVGPARGSSCGSLVCYLLDITAIDPIPYGLLFERFIDTTRSDLPDIDIDFSDTRRQLVFDYAAEKYGEDHVARLGTVGMFKPRSALKGAGAALKIPSWRIDKVLDVLLERSSGDARALQQLEDTLHETENGKALLADYPELAIAARMEGHPNNASQHAAGIVLTQGPVTDVVAVDMRTNSAMCDKKDAEELNLLKIDALGLKQLSVFERTLELIGKPAKAGYLESLPLNDKAAYDVLNKAHFAGVFQFNGTALQSLAKHFKIETLEDIVSITALARPGPMTTGGAGTWVKRRTGKEEVTYPHKAFEPYLKQTLGVFVYQEQVMTIGRGLGDLSWKDVTALRKAMSRSLGREYFDQFGDRWKANAVKKGIPMATLNKVWDDMCAFGAWGFNRSHAVAYALVSYWCCWLKAHHPLEFAAATLDGETDISRQLALLRELAEEGVSYVPVDPLHSTANWTPIIKGKRSYLVGPLKAVNGIGPVAVQEILEARAKKKEIRPALMKRLTNAKTPIDSLYPVADRVKQLYPKGLKKINIVSTPTPIVKVQQGWQGDVVVVAVVARVNRKDENEEVNVMRRGYKYSGDDTISLAMHLQDDTDKIYCKIDRRLFKQLGAPMLANARPGKSLYAVRGNVPQYFRMINVKNVRYLGELEDDLLAKEEQKDD